MPASRPPNIVLVLVDDLGLEGFGCYGGEDYRTPRIDELAASGMQFGEAYTTPLCTPTRIRLLTGREGLRSYMDFSVLDPEERTFAHQLQEAGYVTGVAGKWQLFGTQHYMKWAGRGTRPEDAGFDTWRLWQVEELGSRFWNPRLETDGELRNWQGEYGPELVCDWACEFVEEYREKPFLLFLWLILTHKPCESTPLTDHVVGRPAGTLERNGLREETLFVLTTDNGSPQDARARLAGCVKCPAARRARRTPARTCP